VVLLSVVVADEIDDLISDLEDEDPWIRAGAAFALGEIGDTRAVDLLISVLKDEDSTVREEAAGALGKISDLKAVDPLIEAL